MPTWPGSTTWLIDLVMATSTSGRYECDRWRVDFRWGYVATADVHVTARHRDVPAGSRSGADYYVHPRRGRGLARASIDRGWRIPVRARPAVGPFCLGCYLWLSQEAPCLNRFYNPK